MTTSLVSPGISVNVIDKSYYVSGQGKTIPLIFIATADEKFQSDGITPAMGTYEYGVLRLVTSIQQAEQLYGIPRYLKDASGNPYHGDARNEYGLDALMKVLSVGASAYVIRANVNLADDITDIQALWSRQMTDAADYLNTLVTNYIQQYNNANNLLPTDLNYKKTVTASELETLVSEAMSSVFDMYSFSNQSFQRGFIQDHTISHPGYQDVIFNSTNGYVQLSDVTGLVSAKQYGAEIEIVEAAGTKLFNITLIGSQATTFGDLINYLNLQFGSSATASLLNGRIRITSSLNGVTSSVQIITDGQSGSLPLFGSCNLYQNFDTPVSGTGPQSLNIYDPTYTSIIGQYDGLDSMITSWNSGNIVLNEFTGAEAEGLLLAASNEFDATKEFMAYTSLGANDAARRAAIVGAINASIANPNSGVTSDAVQYNIVAAPGYWECTNQLVVLSQQVRSEVFVVGDTPFDMPATGPNGITTWATTPNRVNNYINGYWYGHALTNNLDGSTIMSSSACTALRTIIYSDSISQIWYAPAGVTRGTCPQILNLGYVSGTLGTATTFVTNYLDQGERDALYPAPVQINPITYIPGRGILVFGQVSSSPVSSALNRVNVVRLTMYIQRQMRQALFAYLFAPNDSKTWTNVKYDADTFLQSIMGRNGIYDYATVCNSQNNTPETIDNNELHLDIYIAPEKDVEFIYVNITLVNTGTDLSTFAN